MNEDSMQKKETSEQLVFFMVKYRYLNKERNKRNVSS